MLKPIKYTNLDTSILGVSSEIIKILNQEPEQKVEILRNKIDLIIKKDLRNNFFLSLGFLFLLGKIKYYQRDDIIELQK